ncbi:MAG TPA: hypothetical protein P5230_01245 [Candidatus Magasanikbacteria bacterium]|nr:hypothetical protein [Candidatus Magasanikbacteria bacterium]
MNLNKFLKHFFEKKYFGIYRHAKKLFIFDIFLLTLAIFLFGSALFWFLWQPSIKSQIEIEFSYSSEKIISGQDLDVIINYKNNSELELNDSILALYLPPGFSLNKDKNNQILEKNTINLSTIPAGGSGKLTISGEIVGNTLENDKILAVLTYKIGKTKKTEQKKELSFIVYSGSYLKSELFIQNSAFPDKNVPFTIKLSNLSQKKLNDVFIALPEYAKISEKNTFDLLPGQELILNGTANIPKTLGILPFSYSVSRKYNNATFIQQSEKNSLEVLSPKIGLKIIPKTINSYIEQGKNLPIDIIFENLSGNILQNQKIILKDKNNILDLSAAAAQNNISYSEQGLIIDATARKIFVDDTNLKSDRFGLELKIKDNAGFVSSNLVLVPEFSATLSNSNIAFTSTGNELDLKILAGISATASAHYYTPEGDQVGRGPLPPQVGQNTKYWIYLDIKNGANQLSNFVFSAQTGPFTIPGEKQSVNYGDKLLFEKNFISWRKESVESFNVFGLYFEVSSTPQTPDIGKEIILLQNAKIEATDTVTGKKIKIDLEPITNKLLPEDKGSEVDNKVIN